MANSLQLRVYGWEFAGKESRAMVRESDRLPVWPQILALSAVILRDFARKVLTVQKGPACGPTSRTNWLTILLSEVGIEKAILLTRSPRFDSSSGRYGF
jgi:hypothetical protein